MTRACGHCTLCCKLIPVAEVHKAAGERCRHQRHTGCAIYRTRPLTCRAWMCRWLLEDDAADLRRPDRSGYVVDMMPDYVTIDDEDGHRTQVPVVQVWVDPKRRDAHDDPALRAFIERRGAEGFGAIVRFGEDEAIVLFPPSLTGKGWMVNDAGVAGPEHSQIDIAEVLTRVTGEDYIAAGVEAFRRL